MAAKAKKREVAVAEAPIGARYDELKRMLIERQRGEYLQALRDLDRLQAATNGDAAQSLLIEGAALHLEADLKWLALCEERLTAEVTPWSTS